MLEFYEAGGGDEKKEGEYIWRTEGDGKVRPSHAERDGKKFSWDNPPEGGHPGDAPNCRCTAEDVEPNECERLRSQLEVDRANVESARDRWEEADKRYNQISENAEDDGDDQIFHLVIGEQRAPETDCDQRGGDGEQQAAGHRPA